ncbi:TPA: hypothetical protein ACGJO3_000961 [Escherichia coli]|jgi:hypothetical protein|uniref:SinR family protein n=1 Tax=Enterobacter cloacae subsp. cloacae TaxID=336306 RepID=A0AAE2EF22_ENTCL|nr:MULTISPECIES: hypothetical protein [Enterobacteriaceae]EFA4036211.1 hypothetical protein [Escherichia coli O120:H10]EFA8562334.1 hypothetical protein [Escherichia coli O157]EFW0659278.1 hypothetical protein [Shigella dysenteriae]ELQ6207924.1 hypothetical protein [Cronobacter sakazakii]ELY5851179.1 hypothetical protein [Cronobacter turicensis]HCD7969319.1 hypothetical protein [Citrobacter amalonaticus]HDR2734816.1 hypothetical protein [Enterobacter ludwigii]
MANNLFITYDLIKTKDYAAVHAAIKTLGNWAKATESNWYVNSVYSVENAAKIVKAAMDNDDRLIVVDATNNNAYWYNLPDEVAARIRAEWPR